MNYITDPHSYSMPEKAVIKHLDLKIDVDFETQNLNCIASYKIENNNATEIVLDSKHLHIEKVFADEKETEYFLGSFDEILGQALKVKISVETKSIRIHYKTSEKTEALQWLAPQQTANKQHPFLFTQGQAILTRTWIPTQDSPQVKITYTAKVKTPKGFMAVMSAQNPKEISENGEYSFVQENPVSPYLIALAVGDFEYKEVSHRTGVYAEPNMLDKVHYEFVDLETMVSAAEKLYGDYVWGRFDVIVLPPSFPYGGMENPCLTFATPTIITGDRSLTTLVAHELAHSWSGNLVTNASWDHLWLNEGFTVYFELRIMEAIYGKERADMLAMIDRKHLDDELARLEDSPERTRLKTDTTGLSPDEAMTQIAYNKGYLLLRTMEENVGRDVFDAFLKSYFETHAFSTMATERFIAYLKENLKELNFELIDIEQWIYREGIPEHHAKIHSTRFEELEKHLKSILLSRNVNIENTKHWTSQEWVHFINCLPYEIDLELLFLIDKEFTLSHSNNPIIQMEWFKKAIGFDYWENNIDEKIEEYLITIGRRWLVTEIYTALKNKGYKQRATEIYKKARQNYHFVTANTLDKLLSAGI